MESVVVLLIGFAKIEAFSNKVLIFWKGTLRASERHSGLVEPPLLTSHTQRRYNASVFGC